MVAVPYGVGTAVVTVLLPQICLHVLSSTRQAMLPKLVPQLIQYISANDPLLGVRRQNLFNVLR